MTLPSISFSGLEAWRARPCTPAPGLPGSPQDHTCSPPRVWGLSEGRMGGWNDRKVGPSAHKALPAKLPKSQPSLPEGPVSRDCQRFDDRFITAHQGSMLASLTCAPASRCTANRHGHMVIGPVGGPLSGNSGNHRGNQDSGRFIGDPGQPYVPHAPGPLREGGCGCLAGPALPPSPGPILNLPHLQETVPRVELSSGGRPGAMTVDFSIDRWAGRRLPLWASVSPSIIKAQRSTCDHDDFPEIMPVQ